VAEIEKQQHINNSNR